MAWELSETERTPTNVTLVLYGTDDRTIEYDSKVKLQFTGPGSETLFNDGPADGKKWKVFIQLHIDESDA